MELGYLSKAMKLHSCHNCGKNIKKDMMEYRWYHRDWSRGTHIDCAHEIIKEILTDLKGVGRRNQR